MRRLAAAALIGFFLGVVPAKTLHSAMAQIPPRVPLLMFNDAPVHEPVPVPVPQPGTPKRRSLKVHVPSGQCASWMFEAGITNPSVAYELIVRESSCDPGVVNRSSGACGIPQSLPCRKMGPVRPDGTSTVSPVAQLVWMQAYVLSRYGSWEAALRHRVDRGWY